MCLTPRIIGSNEYPCGQCAECLLQQELTLGFVGQCNTLNYRYCASITLTYDDEHLPLMFQGLLIDDENRTFRKVYDNKLVYTDNDIPVEDNRYRDWHLRDKKKTHYLEYEDYLMNNQVFNDYEYLRDYTCEGLVTRLDKVNVKKLILPVANVSHLQNWFKTLRTYYKRFVGDNLDLVYTAVTEYGPHTGRPHYHICMFYNDCHFSKFVRMMCSPAESDFRGHKLKGWKYGSVNTCNIVDVYEYHPTGQKSQEKAYNFAKYIAKYGKKPSKAKYWTDAIGLLPPVRRMTSKGFNDCAIEIADQTILKDIPEDIKHIDPKDLNDIWDLLPYAEIICDRMEKKYSIFPNCKPTRIPLSVVRRALAYSYRRPLYGYPDSVIEIITPFGDYEYLHNPHYVTAYKNSALFCMVTLFKASRDNRTTFRDFQEFSKQFDKTDTSLDEIVYRFAHYRKEVKSAHSNYTQGINNERLYTEPRFYK